MKSIRTSGTRKVLGILGGMGPEATMDLYREIISLTTASRDQDHIPTIILSNPGVPDRTESILRGHHKALPYLIDGVTFLEHAGADFVVMPCNTAHYYIDDLRGGIRIPILSIIEETVTAIRKSMPVPARVGILGSDGTQHANLYGQALQQAGIGYVYPDARHQPQVMAAIRAVKAGPPWADAQQLLERSCRHLKSLGAEAAILGCTELPILVAGCSLELPCINPTRILAASAVAFAMKS